MPPWCQGRSAWHQGAVLKAPQSGTEQAFFKRMAAMVFKNTSKMEVQGGAGMKHTAIILGKDKPTLVFLKTMAAIRLKNAC